MTNTLEENIIFSIDDNYAYRLRNKLDIAGIKTQYVTETEALLYFMLQHNKGLILIDCKVSNFSNLVKDFSSVKNLKNFSFIYLTDNDDCDVKCDEVMSFKTNFEGILPTVAIASREMNKRHEMLSKIPDGFIDKTLIELLEKLEISSKHIGYIFIKDATKLLINNNDSSYHVLKDIYQELAKLHDKSLANIEKSIRLAISKAENSPAFKETFKNIKVSNSVLLKYLAEKIKNLYYNSSEYKNKDK